MEMYMVGGCVRDELLGVQSKDIDFTVVLTEEEKRYIVRFNHTPFEYMAMRLNEMGFEIFLETPEYLTIRARFPKGHLHTGLTADFVLARKESGYTDGRRPDVVEPGTLFDDLARRDFTMNAMAKDSRGNLLDPFGGLLDVRDKIIRCVGDPHKRFEEDALRIVRAMRFSVTKGFTIEHNTWVAMNSLVHTVAGVSAERVREELTKMFNADPMKTVLILKNFNVLPIIFDMGINFQPTLKEKVR
jgi:tRNA nucleotidyltransferase/poly(A) polymerase